MIMKKHMTIALCLCLIFCAVIGCSRAAGEETPVSVTGTVRLIEPHGHARLDISIEAFKAAGFALGDVVTVRAGTYEGDMPYLDGYYVGEGEYMVRALPEAETIAICLNYGKIAEVAGLKTGDPVTITMKEKGGALTLQELSSFVTSFERNDYSSDEEFANFRPIIEGKVYRSASPVDNQENKAATVDALIRKTGIQAAMNLANREQDLTRRLESEEFASTYYRELYDRGNVIALGLPANFGGDEFGEGLVKGFSFLLEHEGPWLIHCRQGKDRAGFASMVLEMLAGWKEEDIIADYLLSYWNYYKVESGSEQYNMIVERDVKTLSYYAAELEKSVPLEGIDWQAEAREYLMNHGMSQETVDRLQAYLTE